MRFRLTYKLNNWQKLHGQEILFEYELFSLALPLLAKPVLTSNQ